ncbi:MAG TPA: DUF3016 domain-containing protein, partial [Telluria sp.]|nr:DUF3016 domain-containing protein [Telluria sp.]
MKRSSIHRVAAVASLSLSAWALPASAAVTVTFVQPEQYRDLPFSPIDREHVLRDMGEHFAKLESALPPGQDLKVDVLDFDLAGRMSPNTRAGQDLRVLRGRADWPH